jgi:hypothetical protein
MSRGHILSIAAGTGLALLASWIVLERWVLPHRYDPRPGVRTTIWKRARELPPRPEDGLAVKRATYRAARRYVGPAPSDQDLAVYEHAGQCDAFHDYLRQEWRERVDTTVAELDGVLDDVSDAVEAAIEDAKERIRGTDDEFVHQRDRSKEENDKAARDFGARAQAAGDMCVTDSWGGAMRHYRISRSRYPRVYELRQQDADLNGIRQGRLHEEIAQIVSLHGRDVLDAGEMERVWAEAVAQARR